MEKQIAAKQKAAAQALKKAAPKKKATYTSTKSTSFGTPTTYAPGYFTSRHRPETLRDKFYYWRLDVRNAVEDAIDDVEEWVNDRVDRIEKKLKNKKLNKKQKKQLESAKSKVVHIGETSMVVLDGAKKGDLKSVEKTVGLKNGELQKSAAQAQA